MLLLVPPPLDMSGGDISGTDMSLQSVRPSHRQSGCDSAFGVSVNEMSELGGGCENVALFEIQNTGWKI